MAKAIEAQGIPTVITMMYRQVAEALKPPRVTYVRFPFGQPLGEGEPHNHDQHHVIVEDALRLLATAKEPGAFLELPYRWRREDYTKIRQEQENILAQTKVKAL